MRGKRNFGSPPTSPLDMAPIVISLNGETHSHLDSCRYRDPAARSARGPQQLSLATAKTTQLGIRFAMFVTAQRVLTFHSPKTGHHEEA